MNSLIPQEPFSENPEMEVKIRAFLQYLPMCNHKISLTAQKMGVTPVACYSWMKKYNGLGDVVKYMRDLAEAKKDHKADNVIDKSMDSENEKIALGAAMFIKKLTHISKSEVTSKNVNLNLNRTITEKDDAAVDNLLETMIEKRKNGER